MLDALKLLRIPFSIFLMPVFWLSLILADTFSLKRAILIFLILHLFVYPASNGYNSYYDKDEESIGGLKKPPKVNSYLFPLVLLFDFLSIGLSFIISPWFTLLVTVYVLVSKAYSWDKIRLKKYPVLSTLVVTVFQGGFIYLTIQYGLGESFEKILNQENILLAITATLFLVGSYPLTQVYQHNEDRKRGDETLSLKLGILGTFYFSSVFFMLGTLLLSYVFLELGKTEYLYLFLGIGSPILFFFTHWFLSVKKEESKANFENAMKMNMISSLALSIAFMIMLLL